MFKKPKKRMSLLLVSVMVLSIFLSGTYLSPPEVAAAIGSVINYEFDDLPYNDTYNLNWDPTDTSLPGWNVNWNYDWAKPQKGMRVIPSATPLGLIFEPINGNASSTVDGEYVRFNFEVPDGGWYNIDLTYFKYYGGSTCDIQLDNVTVVSGFSFYAATKSSLLTQNLKTGFKLKEGRHTLTFKCTGTSLISGLYYNFFYLNKLTLTQVRGTTYKFTNLPDNNPTVSTWDPTDSANAGYDPDWHYAKTSPARGLRLVGETLQLINQAPTGAVNGEFITVNFDVPEGGTYNLYLTSFKNIAGGTYRIKVDSTIVKSSHSFYASTGTSPATEALASGISLTKGLHELTFELLSTVKLTSNNLYYGYLYLTDLQLELTASSNTNSKTSAGYYTDARVNAARANVNNYTWAAETRDAAVAAADQYLAKGNDWIWSLPTAQSLPRGYAVNQSLGCLNCGSDINAYGNYPYLADPFTSPWKLECPNCHLKFPTNDFESYYNSGLDHHGVFNAALADSSYLVNTAYPERGASWGVDNGC